MAKTEDRHERAADELIGELLTKVAPAIGDRIHKRVAAGLAALEAAESAASSRAAEPPPAQAEGRWIAVSAGLPDEDQLCVVLSEHWSGHEAPPELAMREGKATEVVWARFLVDETDDEAPAPYIEHTVTHWMPLPPPPATETK